MVEELVSFAEQLHHDPVVGRTLPHLLLEEIECLHNVFMVELLEENAIVKQVFCLILAAEFVICEAEYLPLGTRFLLSAMVCLRVHVSLLLQTLPDLVQVGEIMRSIRLHRNSSLYLPIIFNFI